MPRPRLAKFLKLAALLFVLLYAAASMRLGPSRGLALLAMAMFCLATLFANFTFLINTGTAYRRPKIFWALLSVGCTLWLAGLLIWTSAELSPQSFGRAPSTSADFLFFLGIVPMLAALGTRPHRRHIAGALRYGYIDLTLLFAWFFYLYAYFLVPAGFLPFDLLAYQQRYFLLAGGVGGLLLMVLAVTWRSAQGAWRHVYFHLFAATALHASGWLLVRLALLRGVYFFGSLLALPLLLSFLWFGLAGLEAYRLAADLRPELDSPSSHRSATRLAFLGILSMPLLAAWAVFAPSTQGLRRLRVDLSLGAILIGVLLVLLRQQREDAFRRSLLRDNERSLERLQRLQKQLVLGEKLASLGELTAGAAHAINNPLAAIMGYADLLEAEPQLGERSRAAARKIHQQATRTRMLVDSLFGFARKTPTEMSLIDINAILSSAVELRRAQLAERKIALDLQTQPGLPALRADPKLLLQVFYEIMSNAADAMQRSGGSLEISTRLERASIIVEFADSGPGIAEPGRVFDPFYTNKPVGQGAGLGLSLCYGIIQEHGGLLTCRNLPSGGAVFRIELPAVILPLPLQHLLGPAARTS